MEKYLFSIDSRCTIIRGDIYIQNCLHIQCNPMKILVVSFEKTEKQSWLGYGPDTDYLTSIHKVPDFISTNKESKRKVDGRRERDMKRERK